MVGVWCVGMEGWVEEECRELCLWWVLDGCVEGKFLCWVMSVYVEGNYLYCG